MPAIAVVAAVGTVSAGAALGGVLGGIMVAGGVMTGLGAVTGNKELTKWGAIASLGAGIGSAMGLAGAANNLANSVTGAVPGDALFASGASRATDLANAAAGASGMTGSTSGLADVASTGMQASTGSGGMIGQNMMLDPAKAAPFGAPASHSGLGTGMSDLGAANSTQMFTAPPPAVQPVAALSTAQPADPTMWEKIKSAGGGAMDFIKNKDNAEVLKMGSGLISGAMNNYSQQNQLEQEYLRKREMQDEARARYNASITDQMAARGPRTILG